MAFFIVTCENLKSEIWKLLCDRLFEVYIRANAQTKEKELLEISISFAALP
jgi:hypothetical protein